MNTEAAEILAIALEKDAMDHDQGKFEGIGMRWDDVYGELLPIEENIDSFLYVLSFRFWDDWPKLAREISQCLRNGEIPTNPMILENFKT